MSDNKKLTSVVITCHNYGRYLKECIDSVIAQTVPLKEIIVINDGSDDNTEEIAKEYGDKIMYFKVDFLNGQKTRNFGLKKATGKYIIYLDADDYFRNDAIEKMQIELERDETLCLVYPDRYNFGNSDILKKHNFEEYWHSVDFDYYVLQYFNYIPLPSLARREIFTGFDESVKRFQDWDAWLTYLSDGKNAKRIAEPLYYARFHGKNLTVKTSLLKSLAVFFAKRHKFYVIPFVILKSKLLYDKYMKKK